MLSPIRIGVAGWSLPRNAADRFPPTGSHLQRYAARLTAVEINSSFYRPHRPSTYARWAADTPKDFCFAVKAPRAITHERRLVGMDEPMDRFLGEIAALESKLGPVLVQLPPSLAFDPAVAGAFFEALRSRFDGLVACEPRHASWFTEAADALLRQLRVARVAADPPPHPGAEQPGGWPGLVYRRLHGAPRTYYSDYPPACIEALTQALSEWGAAETWCVFDNTALGHATDNALALQDRLAAVTGC